MVPALIWSAAVFTVGGLLLLERRCLGQAAVVQPLVLTLLCGWIARELAVAAGVEPGPVIETALWMGISLQLLSVGQGHNADWALSGIICSAALLVSGELGVALTPGSPATITLVTAAVLFGMGARIFDKRLARTDCAKQRAANLWERPDLSQTLERLIHGRLRRGFLVGGVQSLVGVGASMGILVLLARADLHPSPIISDVGLLAVPTLGAAVALGSLAGFRFVGYAGAGAAAAILSAVIS